MSTESVITRRCNVVLEDYEFQRDIELRLFLRNLPPCDFVLLEELLHSPPKTPLSRIAATLDQGEESLLVALERLEHAGLLTLHDHTIIMEKEVRKLLETHLSPYEEDFEPGIEYVQGLLRNIPIHVLPTWYSMSRSTTEIFGGVVERLLLSPQIFQRHLAELYSEDPLLATAAQAVFASPHLELPARQLQEELGLSTEAFEVLLLRMELQFVCGQMYRQRDNGWEHLVVPFREWSTYLRAQRAAVTPPVPAEEITPCGEGEAPVLAALSALLEGQPCEQPAVILSHARAAALACDLLHPEEGHLVSTARGREWRQLPLMDRAITLYRPLLFQIPGGENMEERCLREADKALYPAADGAWRHVDTFIQNSLTPLHMDQLIQLERQGRLWRYRLPAHSAQDQNFLYRLITDWGLRCGLVRLGTDSSGRLCFRLAEIGMELFSST